MLRIPPRATPSLPLAPAPLMRRVVCSVLLVCLPVVAVGCGGDEGSGGREGVANGVSAAARDSSPSPNSPAERGLEPWYDDFPIEIELPRPTGGRLYTRTPRQIVETVARNLSGGYGKEAWRIALEFFVEIDDETADLLGEVADRALVTPSQSDLVENVMRTLKRAGNERLSPVVMRALEHSKKSVRDAAMQALATCGTAEAVRGAANAFGLVGGPGLLGWVDAAIRTLPREELVDRLQPLVADPSLGPLRTKVIERLGDLEPELVLAILEPSLARQSRATQLMVWGLRHRVGRDGGVAFLLGALRGEDPNLCRQALAAIDGSDLKPFRDDLMALTTALDSSTRALAARLVQQLGDEQVVGMLEQLTLDPEPAVRREAMKSLVDLGRTEALDDFVEEARTATGTRFGVIADDLANAGYAPFVELLIQRFDDADPVEQKEYLRWMSFSKRPEAFEQFREVFLAPERSFVRDPEGTQSVAKSSLAFVALYLGNVAGAEDRLFELFDSIDRADYRRRALLLRTITEVSRSGRELPPQYTEKTLALLRRVALDPDEIPQMRLHALNLWRPSMQVPDIRAVARRIDEERDPGMRQVLSDFLFETF
jgi:HEAT repeat protein